MIYFATFFKILLKELLFKKQPTMMGLVPPLIQFLTKSPTISPEDLKQLKLVTSGAAPIPKLHIDEFLAKVNSVDIVFKEGERNL
jgi:acyl-CoA synthetase (AMP-forming)/AMP-acid ligase II